MILLNIWLYHIHVYEAIILHLCIMWILPENVLQILYLAKDKNTLRRRKSTTSNEYPKLCIYMYPVLTTANVNVILFSCIFHQVTENRQRFSSSENRLEANPLLQRKFYKLHFILHDQVTTSYMEADVSILTADMTEKLLMGVRWPLVQYYSGSVLVQNWSFPISFYIHKLSLIISNADHDRKNHMVPHQSWY